MRVQFIAKTARLLNQSVNFALYSPQRLLAVRQFRIERLPAFLELLGQRGKVLQPLLPLMPERLDEREPDRLRFALEVVERPERLE